MSGPGESGVQSMKALLAAVLAEHAELTFSTATTHWRCTCAANLARADLHPASVAKDAHRAHVAAEQAKAVSAALLQARSEGWQRAHEECCDYAGNCWGGGCLIHGNPHAAALSALTPDPAEEVAK